MFEFDPVVLAVGSFALTCMAVARFLDSHLSPEWRGRISTFLKTGSFPKKGKEVDRSFSLAVSVASNFFLHLFRYHSKLQFFLISSTLSVVMIWLVFLGYYLFGSEQNQDEILAPLASGRTLLIGLILPLVATVLIDFLAANQTMFFVELMGRCRRAWQFIVLTYGNVLLSITVFSLIFPLAVVLLIRLDDLQPRAGKLKFVQSPLAQSEGFTQQLLIRALGRPGWKVHDAHKGALIAWHFDVGSFDPDGKQRASHNIRIVTTRNFQYDHILDFITDAYKKLEFPRNLRIATSNKYPSFLYPTLELDVSFSSLFAKVRFSEIYELAFTDVNLFNTRSLEMAQGRPVIVSGDGHINGLAMALALSDYGVGKFDSVLSCDGLISRIAGDYFAEDAQFPKCNSWAVVATSALQVELALLSPQASSNIFVAPFAISSLAVTIAVYLISFAVLYAFLIQRVTSRILGLNVIVVEKIPITLSVVILFACFVFPVVALISLF